MLQTKEMGEVIENRIGKILKNRGISAKWLAGKIGVTPTMVSGYVTNRNQPSLSSAYKIAHVLDVPMEDLVVVKED